MINNRRQLLQGMGTAALLAPLLTLEKAMAEMNGAAHAAQAAGGHHALDDMTPEEMMALHQKQMRDLVGDNLYRTEEVAMLLYPGFTALDLVGPHYFFACMFGAKVHLVTSENDLSPVASDLGLAIAPTVRMADVPAKLDVLFIPGGTQGTLAAMGRANVMAFVKSRAMQARFVTSVCTGAMLLAKAGILNGKRATAHWAVRDALPDFGATPVDARIVTDGNIITGAGVSAGLDFAIAMVEKLRGRAYAEALVLQAEYAPQPPIDAGTLDAASGPVSEMMQTMFTPLLADFRAMAKTG